MGVFVQIGQAETAVTCSMKQAHSTEREREDSGGQVRKGRREVQTSCNFTLLKFLQTGVHIIKGE